jgi:hypothetical protein
VQADRAITAAPNELLPSGATNYRRWANFSWSVIERGGPARAGTWDAADAARLAAMTSRAHDLGLWIRFYTLDGFAPEESRGWLDDYNFGSAAGVRARWAAARDARVDLIATDQYEAMAGVITQRMR